MLPHIPLVRSTNAQRRQSDGCGKTLICVVAVQRQFTVIFRTHIHGTKNS